MDGDDRSEAIADARHRREHPESREAAADASSSTDEALARRAIDVLIATFFAVFDNRGSARPDSDRLNACFAEKAVVAHRFAGATTLCTVGQFARPRIALLQAGSLRDFHERETSATTHLFDGIATRISHYEKSGVLDGETIRGNGTRCFQLAETDVGWRIVAFAWVDAC